MDDTSERYLKALAQIERLPEPHLLRYQRQLVERLVVHARDQIPFYRDRLSCLFGRDGAIDFSRWRDVPILQRSEASLRSLEMRSDSLPESYGEIREIRTSGTTGIPLSFTTNGLVSTAGNGAFTHLARWHGADTSRPMAIIRMYPDGEIPPLPHGRHSKGWSRVDPESDVYGLDMRTPIEDQLLWLESRKAPYLISSASHAAALAYAASEDRARNFELEIIFSTAETVLPRVRKFVRERFGAKLVAIYSCQETGYIAIECPVSGQYHVLVDNALVEIVEEDGSPTPPGEVGRVLVTSLYNYATPFIRYAIGDVATASATPCVCGRTLPVIPQIEGRTRSEFIFQDGKRIWLRSLHADAIRTFVPFREFQMVQTAYDVIEFRYVPEEPAISPDLEGLNRYARDAIHPSVKIEVISMASIPRSRGGKIEHFVSLLQEP